MHDRIKIIPILDSSAGSVAKIEWDDGAPAYLSADHCREIYRAFVKRVVADALRGALSEAPDWRIDTGDIALAREVLDQLELEKGE
jgi:hypothetical protein